MPITAKPFRGLTYTNTSQLEQCVAPPYDVIDTPLSNLLISRSPHNVIRLDLNPGITLGDAPANEAHDGAEAFMQEWLEKGILAPAEQPAFWGYKQTWQDDSQTITRQGILAAILLDEDADPNEANHQAINKTILPHERTLHQYIDERIRLYARTATNLSPIFLMGHDEQRTIETGILNQPTLNWTSIKDDDGVQHELAKITDEQAIATIASTLAPQRLLIADGHHRFQTALTMKRIAREAYAANNPDQPTPALGSLPTDYVLGFVTNMADPGLVVYPTHRVLDQLPEGWTVEQLTETLKAEFDVVDTFDSDDTTIQWCVPGEEPITLKLPSNHLAIAELPKELHQLDAALLDSVVFQHLFKSDAVALKKAGVLSFIRDEATVSQQLENNTIAGVFRLHSPPLLLVKDICESGLLMPQKSTYFYPKLLTGLVLYPYVLPNYQAVLPNAQAIEKTLLSDGIKHHLVKPQAVGAV